MHFPAKMMKLFLMMNEVRNDFPFYALRLQNAMGGKFAIDSVDQCRGSKQQTSWPASAKMQIQHLRRKICVAYVLSPFWKYR